MPDRRKDQIGNEKRRKRTLPRRLEALRAGRWIFPPPFGYRLEDGRVLVDEGEAETLRTVFDLYLEGRSHRDIANHLERTGRRTRYGRGRWNERTFARLITNAGTYAAGELRVTMAGESFAHPVEPLIDRATVRRLGARRRRNTSYRGGSVPELTEFTLRGLVKCTCARVWESKLDNRYRRRYYRCPLRSPDRSPTCGNTVGARRVEEHVWSLIFDSILAEDAPRSWIRVTAGVLREDRGDAEAAVVECERLLRGLATERLNLDRQLVREAITEANHAALAAENTGERVVVEAQLAEASARLEAAADVDAWEDQAHTFMDRAAELSVTPAGRLEIHRALIRSVLVWRGEDGEAHFDVDWRVNVTEPATRSSASIST